ncbi:MULTISPECIES: hypothetical protein [Giesbergeria]|uniref:Uncharacterized protein n=1 Tax=Giesbergeria sinuosa TaxID=80883 RepID=A0ABV9QEN7_9BURK
MNHKTSPHSPPLLTEQELGALLQRKAAIQANLKTGSTVAGACSTSSPAAACPGCGCGQGAEHPSAGINRLFKPILAAVVIAVVAALVFWQT